MDKWVFLVITGAYNLNGGIARVNQLMIESLVNNEYQVDIASLYERVGKVVTQDKFISSYRKFSNNKIIFSFYVWWTVLRRKHNWIIVDHINLASILAPLKIFGFCKYSVWLFGTEIIPPRPDREGFIGLKYASRRFAISEFTKGIAKTRFPNLSVSICPLGLDEQKSQALILDQEKINDENINLRSISGDHFYIGKKIILNVARMVVDHKGMRDKGQFALLNSFPLILQSEPEAQLLLVGDGEDYHNLYSLAQRFSMEVQARISMPGFVDRQGLWSLFSTCSVFAMPSSGEGFGLVYLEAMACGKPCIGLRKDATPLLIHDGVNGLLVDYPIDTNQLAEKIKFLLENPKMAHEMGEAGKKLISEKYLFKHFQERFLTILNSDE